MKFWRMVCLIAGLAIVHTAHTTAQELTPDAAAQQPAEDGRPNPSANATELKSDQRPAWRFEWKEHPSLRFGRTLRLDFQARFQFDGERSAAVAGVSPTSIVDLARRRVGVEGQLTDAVTFAIEGELGSGDPWRDVFAGYRLADAVNVQGGKFKMPFSLDETTSITKLDFVYRSRAADQLAPGRDRGVMVHGRFWKRVVGYEVGIFEHDGRNARLRERDSVQGSRTGAVRITSRPFRSSKSPLADLHLGVAFTTGDVPEGISALRGRTALGTVFFPSEFWVHGRRERTGAELRWRFGPFSAKSEYMRVTQQRRGQSVADTDLPPLVASGWYVSGTWILTGEKKTKGIDDPRRPLFRGGVGAIELAARLEDLRFGTMAAGEDGSMSPRAEVVLGNSDRVLTLGVNWQLNRWSRIQSNAIRDRIADPLRGPMPDRAAFWSHVLRLQLTF